MSVCYDRRYHDGYANLAASILVQGVRENDTTFLRSKWADILREICKMDDDLYGNRGIRQTRGVIEHIGD